MTCNNDAPQIWKYLFARQAPDDFVHEIEGCEFAIADLATAEAPTVGSRCFTYPIGLVGRHSVVAIADLIPRRTTIRREASPNNNGVIQATRKKSSSKSSAEMVICVAINAMHEDQSTRDVVVLHV